MTFTQMRRVALALAACAFIAPSQADTKTRVTAYAIDTAGMVTKQTLEPDTAW